MASSPDLTYDYTHHRIGLFQSSPTGFAVELLTSSVDSVVSIACEASEYSSWCSALGKIIFADHPEIGMY